jgi:hypothetical protein
MLDKIWDNVRAQALACHHLDLLHVHLRVHGTAVYTLPRRRRWTWPHLVRSPIVVIYTFDILFSTCCGPLGRRKHTMRRVQKRRTRASLRLHIRPRQVWVVQTSWPRPNCWNTSAACQRRQQPGVLNHVQAGKSESWQISNCMGGHVKTAILYIRRAEALRTTSDASLNVYHWVLAIHLVRHYTSPGKTCEQHQSWQQSSARCSGSSGLMSSSNNSN